MGKKYQAIIVGGGHNSLICGSNLAKNGGLKDILVLEKAPILGGCSRTDPNIFPGYLVDTGAQALYGPAAGAVRLLELEKFGLERIELSPNFRWLLGNDVQVDCYPDINKTIAELEKFDKEEAANYRRLSEDCAPFISQINNLNRKPDLKHTEYMQVLETLGPDAMYMYLGKGGDILRSYFKTDWMVGGLARLFLAANLDPNWPTSGWMIAGAYSQFHFRPFWRAKGGMGGFVGAIAKSIEHYGGEVRLNTGVKKIIIEDGKAKGVILDSGEEIESDIVISGTHFKVSYFDLVGVENLQPKFVQRLNRMVEGYSGVGLFLAMDQEPETPGGPRSVMMTAKGLTEIEDTFTAFHRRQLPQEPSLWINNPAIVDPSVAPPGKYWISFFGIVPLTLAGTTWEAEKEKYADLIMEKACRYIPNLKQHTIDRYVQSPLTIEKEMNLPGASVMGPVMTLDQMWMMRPPARSPIKNLYMTGTSVHPGGGVSGAPGFNTSGQIIEDLKKGTLKI